MKACELPCPWRSNCWFWARMMRRQFGGEIYWARSTVWWLPRAVWTNGKTAWAYTPIKPKRVPLNFIVFRGHVTQQRLRNAPMDDLPARRWSNCLLAIRVWRQRGGYLMLRRSAILGVSPHALWSPVAPPEARGYGPIKIRRRPWTYLLWPWFRGHWKGEDAGQVAGKVGENAPASE